MEICRGCGLPVWESAIAVPARDGDARVVTAPDARWARPRATRREQANSWFVVFCVLTAAGALVSFLVSGALFSTPQADGLGDGGDSFNVLAALSGAAGTVVVWLPVIALFDYLRRDEPGT